MNAQLITTWSEHDRYLQKILALASKTLCIFDHDLSKLKLEQRENAEALRRFLSTDRQRTVSVVVKNAEPFRRDCPRLMTLLATHPQNMGIIECPFHLVSLNDSMLIADDKHALIRFHTDNVRSKAIIDDAEECVPYVYRFKEILKEGGERICATTLGL